MLCAERPKPQKTGSAWMHLATLYRSLSLLLRDVIVWDKANNNIDVPLLYLARDGSDIHIEFPYREPADGGTTGETS